MKTIVFILYYIIIILRLVRKNKNIIDLHLLAGTIELNINEFSYVLKG